MRRALSSQMRPSISNIGADGLGPVSEEELLGQKDAAAAAVPIPTTRNYLHRLKKYRRQQCRRKQMVRVSPIGGFVVSPLQRKSCNPTIYSSLQTLHEGSVFEEVKPRQDQNEAKGVSRCLSTRCRNQQGRPRKFTERATIRNAQDQTQQTINHPHPSYDPMKAAFHEAVGRALSTDGGTAPNKPDSGSLSTHCRNQQGRPRKFTERAITRNAQDQTQQIVNNPYPPSYDPMNAAFYEAIGRTLSAECRAPNKPDSGSASTPYLYRNRQGRPRKFTERAIIKNAQDLTQPKNANDPHSLYNDPMTAAFHEARGRALSPEGRAPNDPNSGSPSTPCRNQQGRPRKFTERAIIKNTY